MDKRFRSLRIIGTVFKILAWITLALGVVGAFFLLVAGALGSGAQYLGPGLSGAGLGGVFAGLVAAIGTVIGAVFSFLCLYATGDAIYLALAIEENTREAAHYLKGGDTLPRQV